METHKECGC